MSHDDAPLDPPPAPPPSLRDRTLGLRGVLAVALASVVLGASGGVALGAITDDAGSDTGRTGPVGPGGPGGGFGGQLPAPPTQPGTAQPGTAQPGTAQPGTAQPGTQNS